MPAIEKERALKKNNVLLSADYRSPQSGNFISSVLDLADWMQDKGSKLFFLFPQSSSDHGWVQWIRSRGYTVYFIGDHISAQEKQSFFRKLIEDNQIRLRPDAPGKTVLRKRGDGHTWLYTGDLGYMDADGFVYRAHRFPYQTLRPVSLHRASDFFRG